MLRYVQQQLLVAWELAPVDGSEENKEKKQEERARKGRQETRNEMILTFLFLSTSQSIHDN